MIRIDSQMAIAFLGGGNMARAMLTGLQREGHVMARVLVIEPDAARGQALIDDFGVQVKSRQVKAISATALVVLAVKPQLCNGVVESVASRLHAQSTLLSIVAGVEVSRIRAKLGREDVTVVRVMPNSPAQIGCGISVLFSSDAEELHRARAEYLMRTAGELLWVQNEVQMHAVTAISGSGPAYFFLMAEVMAASGVAMGLPADVAARLANYTAYGAGRMLAELGVDAPTLRQQVTSPNGTTQAALDAMYDGGLPDVMRRAVAAAQKRSKALSKE
ncbi:MAG: pyrroline-5-carboxylate reductase [Mariprofundales bacterium]|nr:pyrroline-5-carboxylate reductase [Mariprofundales bacterium]